MEANENYRDSDEKIPTSFCKLSKHFSPITYIESLKLDGCEHAAHCMIFTKWKTLHRHKKRATVLMQLRFDGKLGFPGGIVNRGENPVDAVNRKMVEEIHLDLSRHRATEKNHIISHFNNQTNCVTHFFAFEVNIDDFKLIEKRCLDAREWGRESLGILRPCLYTRGDNIRGFPSFLKNNFVGNSKEQFCVGLNMCNIMTEYKIRIGLQRSEKIQK